MSYPYRPGGYSPRPERRRSRAFSCLLVLTIFVLLLLILAIAVLIVVRPQVSKLAGTVIGSQLEQQLQERMRARIGEGQEIPPDFAGEVAIADAEINQYIAEHPQEIAPLDSAHVRFVPGEIVVEMEAYGVNGQAHAGLAIQDGRVVAVNPRIDGPLSLLLDAQEIAGSLEQELNAQLTRDGKQVTEIFIEQGQIIAVIEPR
ncbi:MAG: hypothetical protein KatS3mg057_1244 [Herpetosiphonaceae bacterium]|nr:MAG: hypothetical protein KatS3mg057_1244 [Herpetosiphonaceae bacterium]